MNITVNPLPAIPTITASDTTTFCQGQNVILTSDPASSYLWSNGAITQSITVTNSGIFHVMVLNANSCAALSNDMIVTVLPSPAVPVTSPDGQTTFCSGDTLRLTASTADSYLWSTGAIVQSIIVTSSDIVNVTVTSDNGCSATSPNLSVTVHPNVSTPTIQATGATTFCEGDSVILTSSEVADNNWSNGESTQSIAVTTSGIYHVTVQNTYGCSAVSSDLIVLVNPTPIVPIITPDDATEFCQGDSVHLFTDISTAYLWSSGQTTRQITATDDGLYNVTVTNQYGCKSHSLNILLTVHPNVIAPTIQVTGNATFCQGDSVILTSSETSGNHWSNGATSQSIVVSTSGIFNDTIQNVWCVAVSEDKVITMNPKPGVPVISHVLPLNFCEGDSVVLVSDPANSYLWSNAAATRQITVKHTGIYDVIVTNQYGCANSSLSTQVEEFIVPKPVILRDNYTLTATEIYDSYQWYFNGIPGAADTSRTIHINQDGSYVVEGFDANGCSKKSDPHQTTDIKNVTDAGNKITVFPNPFSESTTFMIETHDNISDVSFTLFDVLGKAIKAEIKLANNKYILNREGLSTGLYYYQFTSKTKVIGFGKLVIN